MNKQLRILAAALAALGQTLPVAAQSVTTKVAPVVISGPAAVAGSVAAALPGVSGLQASPLALAKPVVSQPISLAG
ncbi:MAG: hypothetical protein HY925_05190, partial [Elusimicrobia bacterium]|nr:hypothetical protein [Elusimicrobiota bacterium]